MVAQQRLHAAEPTGRYVCRGPDHPFFAGVLPIDPAQALWPQLFLFIAYGYAFKLVAALLDTGPFYACVYGLSKYLWIESPVFATPSQPQADDAS